MSEFAEGNFRMEIMDPQELTRLIREKQSNLDEKVQYGWGVGGMKGMT